jgi:2'-hydroxyisoflavone reductase
VGQSSLRLLILGGTRFLGRHLVDAALARGHSVTLFTRGQSNPDLYAATPGVTHLTGNRDGDLTALEGKTWDAVMDTSGYFPRVVGASANLLAGAANHYTFVSSISVYRDFAQPGIDEAYPAGTLADETIEEITGDSYGPLKALCEQAVERAFPGRTLNVRPGLIVGPHDPTDRFTYWPHRVAQGGEVLAPGGPDQPVQVIDVRDLAQWIVRAAEAGTTGVFNATGPATPLGLGRILDACIAASQSTGSPDEVRRVGGHAAAGASHPATITWVDEAFLLEREVRYWQDLPAVLPESDPKYRGMARIDVSKAVAAGLTFRSIEETVKDTLAWDATRPTTEPLKAGLTPDREAALLREWHSHGSTS